MVQYTCAASAKMTSVAAQTDSAPCSNPPNKPERTRHVTLGDNPHNNTHYFASSKKRKKGVSILKIFTSSCLHLFLFHRLGCLLRCRCLETRKRRTFEGNMWGGRGGE